MRLILENWRQYIKEQDVPDEGTTPTTPTDAPPPADEPKEEKLATMGQLRDHIKNTRRRAAGKIALKRAALYTVSLIPGAGLALAGIFASKDAYAAYRKIIGASDKVKTNTAVDKLNIPDEASKILDDNLETEFIKFFMESLKELPDTAPIPDAAEHLEKWLTNQGWNKSDLAVKK